MATSKKRSVGDLGEGIVCKYLIKKGFLVLERNYLRPWGEIDIVVQQGNKLHFVEVKSVTREPSDGSGFRPEDNMHRKKIQRLHRAIQTYLLQHKQFNAYDWQIDLACVYLDLLGRKAKVDILENVF